jgi:hypothetical protein
LMVVTTVVLVVVLLLLLLVVVVVVFILHFKTWCRIYIVYLKCLDLSELSTPKQGKKFISIYVRKHLVFEVQPENVSVKFLSVGTYKALVHSAPIESEEALQERVFVTVRPLTTAPGSLKVCSSPWSDRFVGSLIQVEDVLSNCCELWLDKQQELKKLLNWEHVQ